ncbi:hypothetical protein [Streptomyces leeuwenhoekii]|jgi:hypothetical protein|uniref:Membrane protein n=1 Tax=Streptomyces leeuwenhoekii TaxID=1437453 RepID=A0A0F7VVQ6_STRLW|nr:hypothetical protein [Streptomyces leeuwenhoekii]KMS80527.1 membrane protein [Streptomyces leeuwenhoekii]CQR62538.1 Hypothetical Protein sle_30770 [Streptomyces leeuwenhoekii]
MHSEPAFESRAAVRGRRRKRGNGSAEGPVFVDTSGRRARLLRRLGLLLGVVCLGYATVLGLAFMGIGTSVSPSSLLPFGGGRDDGRAPGAETRPGNGAPTGAPPAGAQPPGQAPAPTGGASAAPSAPSTPSAPSATYAPSASATD